MSDLVIRIVVLVLALAIAAGIALALRRRDRRVVPVAGGEVLTPADLAGTTAALGSRATFVQFSSPVCTGCRATARVLDQLTADDDGLRRIEIDVTERLDLARRLDVMSTPTTLVLDPRGQVISRFTGVPTADQARDAAGSTPPSVLEPSLNPMHRS